MATARVTAWSFYPRASHLPTCGLCRDHIPRRDACHRYPGSAPGRCPARWPVRLDRLPKPSRSVCLGRAERLQPAPSGCPSWGMAVPHLRYSRAGISLPGNVRHSADPPWNGHDLRVHG
ncbi:Hypothetical protein SCLAV_p0467 (plasmid) [Streptomyces clavuligerus]|uniref:Uncharacterized protein n=1 Tax=Streptomyces clavuligerus TaxID=1901 RepID=D5SJ64_STRCL|nr:Hypothetical protein SCLAV_p0467 [Streptomyces clavuligerus]